MLSLLPVLALVASCGGKGGTPPTVTMPNASRLLQSDAFVPSGSRTWFVSVGAQTRDQALEALDFFPGTITIDVGDTILFTVKGNAHTVTFFGPRKTPRFPVNNPFGGPTYDGTVYTSSGAMFPSAQYKLTFTKAGKFPYQCLFHGPEMTAMVVVNPAGTPYPHTQSYYNARGRAKAGDFLAAAGNAIHEFPYGQGGDDFVAGIAPGLSGGKPSFATVLRFLNSKALGPDGDSDTVTIHVGDTLTWTNQSNNEPHTITFAGGHPLPKNPFSRAQGGNDFYGDNLVNSGPLFPGQSFSLTFHTKGTYKYVCLVHDFAGMHGKVVVEP